MELHSFHSMTISQLVLSALETISVKFLFTDAYFYFKHYEARCKDVSGKILNCEESQTKNIMKCGE